MAYAAAIGAGVGWTQLANNVLARFQCNQICEFICNVASTRVGLDKTLRCNSILLEKHFSKDKC